MKKKTVLSIFFFVALFAVSLLSSSLGWKRVPLDDQGERTIWIPRDWEYHADSQGFTNGDGEMVLSFVEREGFAYDDYHQIYYLDSVDYHLVIKIAESES